MAYVRPPHLGHLGDRRVAGPLSMTNLGGLLAGAALVWGLAGLLGLGDTRAAPLMLLRTLLAAGGGALGVAATFRWTGISLWDTALLLAGLAWRRALGQTVLHPPPAATGPAAARLRVPIYRDGQIIGAPSGWATRLPQTGDDRQDGQISGAPSGGAARPAPSLTGDDAHG